MTPQKLLRRMNAEDIQTAFGGMFFGKVCEYLSHETKSSIPLMHISEWLDEETRYEAEMEFYFDQYHMKDYCGAEGKYGFHVEINRVSISAYENEDLYDELTDALRQDVEQLSEHLGYLQDNYSARDLDDPDQKAIFGVFKDRFDYLFPEIEPEARRIQWDRDMYDIILEGITDDNGVYGAESMMLCMVTCPALDEWIAFLQGNVDEKDRRKSRKLLKDFFAKDISRFFQNTIFEINSHGCCKPKEWDKRKYQYLALQLYDGPSSGYYDLYDPFHSGLLAPFYVAGMLDVKEFLEKMDRKYHFLSIETE